MGAFKISDFARNISRSTPENLSGFYKQQLNKLEKLI